MKKLLSLSVILLANTAFAQPLTLNCEGLESIQGSHFELTISGGSIEISKNTTDLNGGTYKLQRSMTGRDGAIYSVYDLGSVGNESFTLLLDRKVVAQKEGIVKIREQGEDFYDNKFFCKE